MDNGSCTTRFFHKRFRDAYAKDTVDTQNAIDDGRRTVRKTFNISYLRHRTTRHFPFSGRHLRCCADCTGSEKVRAIESEKCGTCYLGAGDIFDRRYMFSGIFVRKLCNVDSLHNNQLRISPAVFKKARDEQQPA